jgi:hypothetical protein
MAEEIRAPLKIGSPLLRINQRRERQKERSPRRGKAKKNHRPKDEKPKGRLIDIRI